MNIHEAAIEVLHTDNDRDLPDLCHRGLCYLFREIGVGVNAYWEMARFTGDEQTKLGQYGHWTDERLNIVILLAITTPEDFI